MVVFSSLLFVCGRKKSKQVLFIVCVLVFLCIFSSIQYIMTAVLLSQWPPYYSEHSDPHIGKIYQTNIDLNNHAGIQEQNDAGRRSLGVVMPTIDYTTFKRLERSSARSDDPDVIRLAREAMMSPPQIRRKVKIRWVKKTGQAQAVEEALNNKTAGFFVECGAFDGETSSNTVYLEHFRKWSGLLIEMDPYFYTQLVGKRRNAWSINACLSNNNRLAEMSYFESDGQLGRLDASSSVTQLSNVQLSKVRRPNTALCFPLESLLFALNRTHVDYFSLDVEGYELDILRTIPFDRLDIDVVSAEFLHSREPPSTYDQLMARYGYRRFKQIGDMDLIFVKERLVGDRLGPRPQNVVENRRHKKQLTALNKEHRPVEAELLHAKLKQIPQLNIKTRDGIHEEQEQIANDDNDVGNVEQLGEEQNEHIAPKHNKIANKFIIYDV